MWIGQRGAQDRQGTCSISSNRGALEAGGREHARSEGDSLDLKLDRAEARCLTRVGAPHEPAREQLASRTSQGQRRLPEPGGMREEVAPKAARTSQLAERDRAAAARQVGGGRRQPDKSEVAGERTESRAAGSGRGQEEEGRGQAETTGGGLRQPERPETRQARSEEHGVASCGRARLA